jgi:hypothetical protein
MNMATSIRAFELQDPVRLEDSVWTTLHIALYLGVRPNAALSVVNDYGFPKPLVNKKRDRRWLAEDVKRFFAKKSQGELEVVPKKLIDKSYIPKSIEFKK